jgi:hypothetical protein
VEAAGQDPPDKGDEKDRDDVVNEYFQEDAHSGLMWER